MDSLRSTLPSRLRQLLSGEGAIGPSVKLYSEPPKKVKAFIDKVIQCPLPDIAIPLSGFRWEYGKGNFHHWRPLFHHFDAYFKAYISCRNDLLLSDSLVDVNPFPKQAVLQILRVMEIILENCHNKSSFSGLEHFKLLLASTDPEIVIATLETLSALVKINPSKLHASGKLVGCGSVNSCLLSLAQGWGSKEEGLGLYSCVTINERSQEEGLSLFPSDVETDAGKALGSTLYYELHGGKSSENVNDGLASSSTSVIHLPDLHLRKEDDLSLMSWCLKEYNVPPEHRFSLLTRIRYAHAFRSPRICRLYTKICLLSFIVLVQSSDSHDELVSFFANEPEYTNELIRIVRCEENISGAIRTLSMNALGAQLAAYSSSHERARILSGSSISFAGGNRTILLNVLQRAILSLNSSSDPSSVAFVEALVQFYLLHVISSSSSGSVVRGSGMVPAFLPLLEDTDPMHLHLVCLAVKTLQKLLDYSNAAVTLFKDLGGVELLAHRLEIEVRRVIDAGGAGESSMAIGECSKSNAEQIHSQKRLIRVLLKALGSATYAPANSTRSQNTSDGSLPATLSVIFSNVEKFGGDIYYSTVTVMSEMIHKDPTCYPALHDMGLPNAFLSSVVTGILPSSKALTCVPNGLGAICLNAKGLEAVKETSALRFLVEIFTDKKYVVSMNEGIVPLANAVEELLRHVSSLRITGVDLIIEIINKIAMLGDAKAVEPSGNSNGSTAMEMDSEDKENMGPCSLVDASGSTSEGVTNEQFIQLSIFHVMVLVHRTLENSETCRLFVEKSGIEALFKLLLRPSVTQSSEGMSIALHSTMVFKSFAQHHSAPLARAFCSSLKDNLKKALAGFADVSGSFLLDPKVIPDNGLFSSLFIIEFLLFLAASKDNRWVTALLTEFGNESKSVLEDIGRIHREVLWQIALLEDTKLEVEDDVAGSADESQQTEIDMIDSQEQRFNSFRQFLDPLLRRRTSGWSVESQFFDLINLYRDLSRASGLQQRQGVDLSNSRSGVSHQSQPSVSTNGSDPSGGKDEDRQRSYYHSCCDMMRSLSIHITHLFQELGKVMLLPARRRDDMLNVSPSSKSVASTFALVALDHMNFGGHVSSGGSEASISTKCRYFGKVIEFIDGILLDKPDSCNPVILNCLYGRGVIQSILTTFEATSQLLLTVNRAPPSPMETDEGSMRQDTVEEVDQPWIYGPLASYGKLMDHLATSSFILSPFTKHLLTQPLVSGDVSFPRDAETFVKILQSMILKAVLPVWSHPQFTECNHDFIATLISIIKHVYSGVEVKNVNSNLTRLAGPPPNESTISTIVEMGFSRPRAEEALRQVGSNSVELAMEWLFSHPEETQEDDELARALAMSLGNPGSETNDETTNESSQSVDEDLVQLPPIDDLLTTCRKLLQMKDSLAFPVRGLLLMICSQNDGHNRSHVISFLIDQVKLCCNISETGNSSMLSSVFHVLALMLNEDPAAREVAANNGLVKVASDLLINWNAASFNQDTSQVPKWVTAAFVAIDRLAQVDQKLNIDVSEFLKKDEISSQTSVVIDEDRQNKLQATLGSSSKHLGVEEQKGLIEIACACIKRQLPSDSMHAVLQLCSTLTRTHSVAVNFLDAGGLQSLLALPTSSLFVGFDNAAATIIRHILEDPQTLQQAMESEIKHSVATAANRQSTGRLTPRSFLSNLTTVIQRDPVIFMKAAQAVCQIEMVGERPYVVLLKDREKEKSKEKEKDKEKEKVEEKEKLQNSEGKLNLGNMSSVSPGHGKLLDTASKNAKAHHRRPPHSFVSVIELLLDTIITFEPPVKEESSMKESSLLADMDIDASGAKGKGKAIASSEGKEAGEQDSSATMAKIVFVLKLLTEILLMYASSIHVVLRKDSEVGSYRPERGSTAGIFHHILHKFLPHLKNSRKERKTDVDWRHKLASRGNQFLVASCVRSTEARKRIFTEISYVLNDFVEASKGFRGPDTDIQSFVDFLNDVLAARSPTGSYVSAEASVTFVDVGLVRSLTRVLHVLDLDHAESPKVVTGLVKVLELVTKEHVHATDLNAGRGEQSGKPAANIQSRETDNTGDLSQSMEMVPQNNAIMSPAENVESFSELQNFGGSEAVTDDMEHDQDITGGFADAEDEYMHENSEDRVVENGLDSVAIRFEIQPDMQESIDEEDEEDEEEDDEDDEMSGDDVDEVDEDGDEEEHNVLEEDEVHHLPHHDTDQDDHEMDEDEFDEEVLEEEEEDDDDEEDGVLLRLEGGMNGINLFDHIEVFGRENSFSSETLHVMPVEVFGSRRQGRTTSIYNLLGRSGDITVPSQHPLLVEPSSSQLGNSRDTYAERNLEATSSRVDSYFRSLRNGRHGHRFNLWANDSQVTGVSNASAMPQGLEELLVSQLRRPVPQRPEQNTVVAPQSTEEVPGSIGMMTGAGDDGNTGSRNEAPTSSTVVETPAVPDAANVANESSQEGDASCRQTQSSEMQFEQNDVARDVEAVSQESSGSGATLGESLRSLDVEIGSADGHDDGAGDRTRRTNVSFGNAAPQSARDAPLHSVTEVSENPSQEAEQGAGAEGQRNADADSGSIDPAFLEALPEELRAEVLSAQQGQAPQPQNSEPQNGGDIDPEFLAALPPEIREEVLAQQRAQRLHQSQELEGQPVEMDTVSIIATFPSEIREEVLLTSSDAILANLTPALVAEANMLRERFARRYNRTIFGMYPRNRRGESSRRGEGLDRGSGILARRSTGSKPIEADGLPLVDTEDLKAMIRLLRVVQPLYKGQLQRLLLNLCAHSDTRKALVKILMDLLMLDIRKPSHGLNAAEPLYRLYACQSHVTYSRPQYVDGVPPLVSRRVLETLTYLARHHPFVAKILLDFSLPQAVLPESATSDSKGKAIMATEDELHEPHQQEQQASLALLLSLLKQPLYLRSIAHLEQLLHLLDVIIDNAESKANSSDDARSSGPEQQPGPQISDADIDMNTGSGVALNEVDSGKVLSGTDTEGNLTNALVKLPQVELRLLCSLLAREGLSDNAYTLVAEVMKKLVAISPVHCHLFITELARSVQSLIKSAMDELHIFGEVEKALLSSTSSDGAAILRVLQALSSLVAALNEKSNQILSEGERSMTVSLVKDINAALEPLWLELSTCISKMESYSDAAPDLMQSTMLLTSKQSGVMPPLPAGSQNILPYIESFFVMCEKLHPEEPGALHDFNLTSVSEVEEAVASSSQQKLPGPLVKGDEKQVAFVKFSDKHRKLLNAFIRQNPGLLEKSFSLMLKVPRFIDFDNKRSHFRSKIKHQHEHHHSPLRISVRRAYILEDSYNQLRMRTAQELKGRLTVHFQGEEGIDAGGLTREWYQLLSRVIFDKGALLFTTVGNESTFQPNPNSVFQTEHLSYFKFVGRVVGKALFDGQLLDVHFTRSFYKHILGAKVTYHDIEAIDPDYFKNLCWLLENDISDILDLTFSIDADEEKLILYERTEVTDYELIPGGRNTRVTEQNKHQYVDLVAEHRLTTAIRPQINAFLEGFNEMITRDLISIFNDKELELLISGLPEIDLDDLRANTEYSGYSAASPIIQWFWEVVQGFSKEDKARLLQFVTGTSKVPLEGFSALQGISGSQKFQIHKAYGSPDHLPSAHTW
ncbi:OLC1v1017183C2 [Oldenlandia corymbosa var. corymbosa]|uniref:HECT-type E3 ubiquitin transferase n=1 Tax=Oldenlandia corymbosa var. corymbosa TaxID=529605 RepID=A0AAV1E8U9_OLDCO|nr:OLC1v1017183C2 [Oldenlandia corymbosa var. corymbosa]